MTLVTDGRGLRAYVHTYIVVIVTYDIASFLAERLLT